MRILFLGIIIILLCSCNNNLTTIGEDLADNGSSMSVEKYFLNETYTIKIDSFPTSSGYIPNVAYLLKELFIGRYEDSYSGLTTAEAYFQIAPSAVPSVPLAYVLDSVTFNFTYSGNLWGDTLQYSRQTLELWQLKELPILNTDDDNFLFSNDTLPVERLLSTTTFIPLRSSIRQARFRLSDQFGKELSDKMKDGDPIFNDLPWSFLRYFKGLAIKSGAQNNCIFGIRTASDSLYLRFHYHLAEANVNVDIPLSNTEYMFNHYGNIPAARFAALTNQQEKVSFLDAKDVAVLQGLNGYVIKTNLKRPPGLPQYKTIIRAEIELSPIVLANDPIALPPRLSMYFSNTDNEIMSPVYNTSTNAVIGIFVADPTNRENNKYVFDVTDYYQRLASDLTTPEEKIPVILSLPSNNPLFPTGLNSSFSRVIIDNVPILKIYYATYN